MPAGSGRLIDLPPDEFLDTEEEIHVIAACLWVMSVKYDGLSRDERPKTATDLRRVRLGLAIQRHLAKDILQI